MSLVSILEMENSALVNLIAKYEEIIRVISEDLEKSNKTLIRLFTELEKLKSDILVEPEKDK